jgi:hypothetical protein
LDVFRWDTVEAHLDEMKDAKTRQQWLAIHEPEIDASIVRARKTNKGVEEYLREDNGVE